MTTPVDIRNFIRDVPDFPKPGIIFKDITPLLGSAEAFDETIRQLAAPFLNEGITRVAAIESRGFIFGGALARQLECGLVPIRKPGKLPWTTRRHEYELEYGTDALEMHTDAVQPSDRVLIVDDVLATGGTAEAATKLVGHFQAQVVGFAFLLELRFLLGRRRLEGPVHSLIQYD